MAWNSPNPHEHLYGGPLKTAKPRKYPTFPSYYGADEVAIQHFTHTRFAPPSRMIDVRKENDMVYDEEKTEEMLSAEGELLYTSTKLLRSGELLTLVSVWDCGECGIFVLRGKEDVPTSTEEKPVVLPGWTTVSVYAPADTTRAEALLRRLDCETKTKCDPRPAAMFVLTLNSSGDFDTKECAVRDVSEMDLAMHYGEEFPSFHANLLQRYDTANGGIVLLHGPPGTGKTHYIRFLIAELRKQKKSVLLVPSGFAANLADPGFLGFFLEWGPDQPNGVVLVVEDAENALVTSGKRTTAVSNLLNLTDGLMNDVVKVSVIATVNTDIAGLDTAMTRNGRLTAQWEFRALTLSEARTLACSLGTNEDPPPDSTVADVYAFAFDRERIKSESRPRTVGFAYGEYGK